MGFTQNHALGYTRKAFVKKETTAGTQVKPVTTDAYKALKIDIDNKVDRHPRMDSRQSRSQFERFSGRGKVTWSTESYVLPSGAAGTACDLDPFLEAAFGTKTVTGGVSVAYTPLNLSQAMPTLSICRHAPDSFAEWIWGAWVEKLTLSVTNGNFPVIKAEGEAMGYAKAIRTTLNGAVSASATITVTDAGSLQVGAVVKIGTDDNSGAGFKVITQTSTTVYILETTLTASDLAVVEPFTPDETTAGSPIPTALGSFTLNAVAFPIVGIELSYANKFKPADEAFQTYAQDAIPMVREVTGKLDMRMRRDKLRAFARQQHFLTDPMAVAIGTVAGSICTFNVAKAEFDHSAIDIPETEEVVASLPFLCLATGSGGDELSNTWT